MSQHITHFGGDVELMFQPDLKKISLIVGIGGVSRVLSDEELVSLSKALWYAARIEARRADTGNTESAGTARAG